MNFKIILICIGAMLLAQESDAFFAFNRFGRFGFGGLGFGRFGFGGLGLGGFGLGGFGLPIIPPFIPPIATPFIGKRATNDNSTICSFTSEPSKMMCVGLTTLNCDVMHNFTGLGAFSFIVKDLSLNKIIKNDETVYEMLALKEIDHKVSVEEFTFVNPNDNKPVVLGLCKSEKLTGLGFRFKEATCFEKFEKLVEDEKNLEVQLIISQVL